MSDKIKWSIAAVVLMLILNEEVASWIISAALAYVWTWPIMKAGVCLD